MIFLQHEQRAAPAESISLFSSSTSREHPGCPEKRFVKRRLLTKLGWGLQLQIRTRNGHFFERRSRFILKSGCCYSSLSTGTVPGRVTKRSYIRNDYKALIARKITSTDRLPSFNSRVSCYHGRVTPGRSCLLCQILHGCEAFRAWSYTHKQAIPEVISTLGKRIPLQMGTLKRKIPPHQVFLYERKSVADP